MLVENLKWEQDYIKKEENIHLFTFFCYSVTFTVSAQSFSGTLILEGTC